MSLVELRAEFTKFGSAGTSDHRSVLLAELHEFLTELFLLTACSWIGMVKQSACRDAAGEKVSLGKPD